jgi:hypothetical protein
MERILQIESMGIHSNVLFIKKYSEYNLQKSGSVLCIKDDEVQVKTGEKIIYKVRFSEAEFYFV